MYFPVTFRFSDSKTQDLLVTVSRKLGKNPVETIQTVISDERMQSWQVGGPWHCPCGDMAKTNSMTKILKN